MNIHSLFYDKDSFHELMKQENNHIELEWKRRILIENTPQHGNIIMFYDPFKQGFSYYSDTTGIPYFVLNAIAMKYVMKFSCLDFFIDNKVSFGDREWLSPLVPIYFVEDKKKDDCTKTSKKINLEGAPFAKFKNYNAVVASNAVLPNKKQENFYNYTLQILYIPFMMIRKFIKRILNITSVVKKEEKNVVKDDKIYYYNRFVRLGKMNNYNMLQTTKKENALNGFHSKLLDGIQSETKLQKQVLNYADYKKNLLTKE